MKQIWKYPIYLEDEFTLMLPDGAEPLFVAMQRDEPYVWEPYVWVRVDPDALHQPRRFRLAGTGHPIEDTVGQYIGSFLMHDGELVFHLFEAA